MLLSGEDEKEFRSTLCLEMCVDLNRFTTFLLKQNNAKLRSTGLEIGRSLRQQIELLGCIENDCLHSPVN